MTIRRTGRWPAPRCQYTSATSFIANLAPFPAIEDFGGFPAAAVVFAHLFGRKLLDPVKPARIGRGAKTELGILAGPDQQNRSFRNLSKAGAITKAAIAS